MRNREDRKGAIARRAVVGVSVDAPVEPLESRILLSIAYDYSVIATTGQSAQNDSRAIASLGNLPSVDDAGQVAFQAGYADGGNTILVGDGSTGSLTSLVGSLGTHAFESFVQITNQGPAGAPKVVAQDHFSSGVGPTLSFIRSWDTTSPGNSITLAQGSTQPLANYPFASVLFPSMSDSGRFAFLSLPTSGSGQFLVTGPAATPSGYNQPLRVPTLAVRPAIDDGGDVVFRNGATSTSPIQLYDFSLSTPTVIADTSMGFTALGQQPGISRYGQTVVFYGDLSATGAASLSSAQSSLRYSDGTALALLPLTSGPGIFASVATGAGRVIQRIAGVSDNGQLDPGETNEGGVDVGPFSGFTADARISINSTPANSTAGSPGAVSIVYLATGTDSQLGVYCSTLAFVGAASDPAEWTSFRLASHNLVVEEGDAVASSGRVQNLSIYDSVNNLCEVSFWASTDQQQQVIVRADPSVHSVPVFHQNQGLWSAPAFHLGHSSADTISTKGCALTSLAMALSYAGVPTDPGQLNDVLTASPDGYSDDDSLNWGAAALDAATAGGLPDGKIQWVYNTTSDAQKLAEALVGSGAPIVVHVWDPILKSGITTYHNHFVLVTGVQGDTFTIDDPYLPPSAPRQTLDFYTQQAGSWGDFQARGYVMDPPGDLSQLFFASSSANAALGLAAIDPTGRVTGSAPNVPNPLAQIPGAVYFVDGPLEDITGQQDSDITTEFVYISEPLSGTYGIETSGIGSYTITASGVSTSGHLTTPLVISGNSSSAGAMKAQIRYAAGSILPGLPGDVNGDGTVSFSDLLTLAQNYGRTGATFAEGDLDFDGTVGFSDLLLLAQNYGHALPAAGGAAASADSASWLLKKRKA